MIDQRYKSGATLEEFHAAARQDGFEPRNGWRVRALPGQRVTAETLTMGGELEMEYQGVGPAMPLITTIRAHNDDGIWHIKTDGSIKNGIEAVTHPMTFEYFAARDWTPEFRQFRKFARPWNAEGRGYSGSGPGYDQAGMHIHISKPAANTRLFRLGQFYRELNEAIIRISGRPTYAQHWGDIRNLRAMTDAQFQQLVNRPVGGGYYYNDGWGNGFNYTRHAGTVELRHFRSTSKEKRWRGYFQWVAAMFDYCGTDTPISSATFDNFLAADVRFRDALGLMRNLRGYEPEDYKKEIAARGQGMQRAQRAA